MILQKTEDKAKRVLMMSRTQKKMQMQMMILQKVGEEVEDKPDVLELFHPDLPPVTGTTITIIISIVIVIAVVIVIVIIIAIAIAIAIVVVIVISSFQ